MSNERVEVATFGGGCFWCVEAVIKKLRGIVSLTSGYAAGHDPNPDYKKVCTGETGHAEVIQVEFDASVLSYKDLLEVFMTSHDPTQLNGQGNDIGTQYRSIILYHDLTQKHIAEALLESLSDVFEQPIVTQLEPLTDFYAAEDYHQDYYARNPDNQYCMAVIEPKVAKLRKLHSEKLFQEAGKTHSYELPRLIHNADDDEFLVELEPQQFARLRYRNHGNYLSLDYTEVPATLRGKGYGSTLMELTLAEIKQLGYKVKPICSYTVYYLQKHSKWQDLLVI